MFRVFGVLLLVLGVVLPGYAIVAVVRGRVEKSPRRVKFDPKWRARLIRISLESCASGRNVSS